ncbi:MAG: acetyl-CoA carboxylase carboxyltransferase subunit alpha [Chlamydiae bacterium RIFCSPHIGHO2_12_FULL_27_8]|nr:MAG: acetyl-CoA carboxylase carboxyltransferase subunit alpha [Chlamydiae bacterium RIFCSPHIGHO2_12_FULL_27_8]OGN64979.1 MAG: acetyl-CoA carboxylase carboxyltransferase subunit alpha [Chlamydiae bacterium RIFCSPLOWO2_01_FULL_28_7]
MNILPHEKQIFDYEETLSKVKDQNNKSFIWSAAEIKKLEKKLEKLKKRVYSSLSPMDRIAISRHPNRPHSLDYINNVFTEKEEIFGDRTFQDDKSIISFLCKKDNQKFVVVAQEKGRDTNTRIFRNFGMPHPEGYRKALRVMKLAEKFSIPIISLIDTPGAFHGLSAEERGQGFIIANNLFEMAKIKTPIFVVIIGEGCSGGALAMAIGDVIAMLEHSYYSVISPEGCSSILFKDQKKNDISSKILKLNSEFLLENGIIDNVIAEPFGGAHLNHNEIFESFKNFIDNSYESYKQFDLTHLLNKRYEKFRNIGKFLS